MRLDMGRDYQYPVEMELFGDGAGAYEMPDVGRVETPAKEADSPSKRRSGHLTPAAAIRPNADSACGFNLCPGYL